MNLPDFTADSIAAVVRLLNEMTARVNTVFQREHQADGTHKLPCWINPTPGSSDFASVSGQTWAVTVATMVTTWAYWKHGTCLMLSFEITNTTVGGTPQNHLTMKIPGGFTSKRQMSNSLRYLTDAGARIDGMAIAAANSTTVDIYRSDLANFTGGATDVRGQLMFETTA